MGKVIDESEFFKMLKEANQWKREGYSFEEVMIERIRRYHPNISEERIQKMLDEC